MAKINISEKDLRAAIRESISNVVNEDLNDGVDIQEQFRIAYNALKNIYHSSYIPMSSPSPSSTEMVIRKNVSQAIDLIGKAIIADRQLYRR